ncbi:2Fe-2S iron-sulfur cluster binding domain-containing protein [Rhodobacteraceae bacterium RKSG542]|uniref:2Fe-2S iron-sulfur cluster-binding protein n=1 Tax=Pseudovibrio flavus TaxID=2529854 RepID=UPI0012BD61F9|nr:2Fe-2S iron-sulfur cluster-binding protein [Pseudovibrio flavus]MTI17680.1 2Fe-2S iron-sulfur cluster binding domain-containing protein [Pseudovibrio flavus]
MAARSLKVLVNGHGVTAKQGELLIEAINRSSISLSCDCSGGLGETCRVRIDKGSVEDHGTAIRNSALACTATLTEDLEVFVEPAPKPEQMKGHLVSSAPSGENHLELKVAFTKSPSWVPGQYFRLSMRGQDPVNLFPSFSLNGAAELSCLFFHIDTAQHAGLFAHLAKKKKDSLPVSVEGPFGTSFLRREEERLFVICEAESFAPAWAMAVASTMGQPRRAKQVIIVSYGEVSHPVNAMHSWLNKRRTAADILSTTETSLLEDLRLSLRDLNEFDVVHACGSPSFLQAVAQVVEPSAAQFHPVPTSGMQTAVTEDA